MIILYGSGRVRQQVAGHDIGDKGKEKRELSIERTSPIEESEGGGLISRRGGDPRWKKRRRGGRGGERH